MPPTKPIFERENAYFEKNRAIWLNEGHEGQIAVIKGEELLGFYDTQEEAFAAGEKRFTESFMVREVKRDDEVQVIHRTAWSPSCSV